MLATTLREKTGTDVSVTTVARMLKKLRARWGMARPTVICPWSKTRKSRRVRKILRTVLNLPRSEVAFFEDEVDIHLNPRIGRDWMLPLQQKIIVTPGQNKKRFVAGALGIDGHGLVFVASERKNSDLFIALLEKLRSAHPDAKRIHLVLDNYVIHSSRRVEKYLLERDGVFVLHFLPPYSPDENKIERLWQDLHANVTRNHRCRSIEELMRKVRWYLHRRAHRRAQPRVHNLNGAKRARPAA
jgi:transposase